MFSLEVMLKMKKSLDVGSFLAKSKTQLPSTSEITLSSNLEIGRRLALVH